MGWRRTPCDSLPPCLQSRLLARPPVSTSTSSLGFAPTFRPELNLVRPHSKTKTMQKLNASPADYAGCAASVSYSSPARQPNETGPWKYLPPWVQASLRSLLSRGPTMKAHGCVCALAKLFCEPWLRHASRTSKSKGGKRQTG